MSLDIAFTGLIVAVAAAWAGRRLWRSARRRAAMNSTDVGCGDQPGSCNHCLVAGSPQRPAVDPDDESTPCEKSTTDES